ncbi:copper amine oxidase N-terminal domain-containing protein [Paenibacillus sp. SI8]|uniref:copper amine oxidase N-terminal domain-containing protein n=1 Tax=unclassified Paenibacillus TaxID=185978 RepID=UPI0034668A70
MNQIMKKSLSLLVLSTMMSTGAAYAESNESLNAAEQSSISIQMNGETLAEHGYQPSPSTGTEPMLPLRAVAEGLGFTLAWNPESLSVDLNKRNIFTTVKTGEDRYTINKMYTTLGTAPVLLDSKLYVPASFVNKVLHGSVTTQGNSLSISTDEQQKKIQVTGVITSITTSGDQGLIHIQGIGTDGIVLNVGKDTVYRMLDDTKLSLSDLHIGLTVSAEHSMIATMSLPPQTPTSRITVLDAKLQSDLIGTAGEIAEVRNDDSGKTSLLIKGTGLSDTSPSEVVLQLSDDTVLIRQDGEKIEKSALVKGAQVIGFYKPMLTKSLPPIGQAWKIVLDENKEK